MSHHQLFCIGARCESLNLTQEKILSVFEKRMLKRVFGSQEGSDRRQEETAQ
jgi:hypothetical protein